MQFFFGLDQKENRPNRLPDTSQREENGPDKEALAMTGLKVGSVGGRPMAAPTAGCLRAGGADGIFKRDK